MPVPRRKKGAQWNLDFKVTSDAHHTTVWDTPAVPKKKKRGAGTISAAQLPLPLYGRKVGDDGNRDE